MKKLFTIQINYRYIIVLSITLCLALGAVTPAVVDANSAGQQDGFELQDTPSTLSWDPCTAQTPVEVPATIHQAPAEYEFDCEEFKTDLKLLPTTPTGPISTKKFVGEAWGGFRLKFQCQYSTHTTPEQAFVVSATKLYGRNIETIASDFSVYADLKALHAWREILIDQVDGYISKNQQYAGCNASIIEEIVYMPYWYKLMESLWRWNCDTDCDSWSQQREQRVKELANQVPTQREADEEDGEESEEKHATDVTSEEDGDEDSLEGGDTDEDTEGTKDTGAETDGERGTATTGSKTKTKSVKLTQEQWEELQGAKDRTYTPPKTRPLPPIVITTTRTTKTTVTKTSKNVRVKTVTKTKDGKKTTTQVKTEKVTRTVEPTKITIETTTQEVPNTMKVEPTRIVVGDQVVERRENGIIVIGTKR